MTTAAKLLTGAANIVDRQVWNSIRTGYSAGLASRADEATKLVSSALSQRVGPQARDAANAGLDALRGATKVNAPYRQSEVYARLQEAAFDFRTAAAHIR